MPKSFQVQIGHLNLMSKYIETIEKLVNREISKLKLCIPLIQVPN